MAPDLYQDELALAVDDYRAGRTQRAIAAMHRLCALHTEEPAPARALGTALCNEGDFAGALEPLRRAVALKPADAPARAYLALALLLGPHDFASAREQMDRAVALAPRSFVVRWKEGEFLLRLGYAREAAASLQAALQTDAPDAASRSTCAELLRVADRRAANQYNRMAPAFPPPAFRRLLQRWPAGVGARRSLPREA